MITATTVSLAPPFDEAFSRFMWPMLGFAGLIAVAVLIAYFAAGSGPHAAKRQIILPSSALPESCARPPYAPRPVGQSFLRQLDGDGASRTREHASDVCLRVLNDNGLRCRASR